MSFRFYYAFLIMFLTVTVFASSEKSKLIVDEAWNALQQNNKILAEEKFKEALSFDSQNKRAYIGLTLLFTMQHKNTEAWESFQKFIEIEPNYFPYVYSLMMTRFIHSQEMINPEIISFYESIITNPDPDGVLSAMVHERLGNYYLTKKDFKRAEKHFGDLNVIMDWHLMGPFENISASGYDKVYPPETEFKIDKIYEGKNGTPVKWYSPAAVRKDLWFDFTRYFPANTSIFYGNTFVYSPVKQTVQIRIGTSGSLRAFLNDQMIIDVFDEYNNDLDTYIAEVQLQQGWNRLLVKCGFSEITSCNFFARITDNTGKKIENLKYSSDGQNYSSKAKTTVVLKNNFAEEYFKERIKNNPGEPENYIILSEAYLRNDKTIEAEVILNDAIKLFPDCMLFHYKIIEAYIRGKKYDEMETTFEKIFNTDKTIPDILNYKISRNLENEEYDQALNNIEELEKTAPNSELFYDASFDYIGKKDDYEKLIETSKKAYEQFPYNEKYAHLEAILALQKSKDYNDAIKILEEFVDRNYSQNILYNIAQYYLQKSDIVHWEEYMLKMLELNPASPGYYFNMAETYFSMQNYDKAENNIKKAIDLCYSCANYWNKLGQIYKMKNMKEASIAAYNEALKYDPADYNTREVLRELNEQKSYFQLFEQEDIIELIKNAPSMSEYPNDNGIILFNDMKRIVYKKGVSENSEEILIKVFNKKGIDDFKEYWIGYNSYSEQLIVEKAVVIKKDRSEIKADINKGHIVFKSLEENDFLYIKYRIKNNYSGKLSSHYWDSFNFNLFYPVKKISYSILLEDSRDFKYLAQNMDEKPVIKNIKEGAIYRWELKDVPPVSHEYGMPLLSDAGKVLHISNIPDWGYLVDWYMDLSKHKTRSTYEIRKLVTDLFEDKENLTEEKKIQIIYNYVTDNIRYSSISFRQSGFVPQTARDVLINKIGDCKDKAVLCKALLNEVGINSYLVLINTTNNGLNKSVLPSLCFNHCILCVETSKGEKFIDLTAENFSCNTLPVVDLDGFYLLIKPGVTSPSRICKDDFELSNVKRISTAEISPDGKISVSRLTNKTGILGAYTRSEYRYLENEDIKKSMSETLSDLYPNIKLTDIQFKDIDNIEKPAEYTLKYEIPDYVSETGDFLLVKIPWGDKLETDPGFSYEKRIFPYIMREAGDTLYEEFTLKIPENYEVIESNFATNCSSSFAEYSVSAKLINDCLIGKRTYIYKKYEIPVDDYAVSKEFFNKVIKADNRQILFKKKQ